MRTEGHRVFCKKRHKNPKLKKEVDFEIKRLAVGTVKYTEYHSRTGFPLISTWPSYLPYSGFSHVWPQPIHLPVSSSSFGLFWLFLAAQRYRVMIENPLSLLPSAYAHGSRMAEFNDAIDYQIFNILVSFATSPIWATNCVIPQLYQR